VEWSFPLLSALNSVHARVWNPQEEASSRRTQTEKTATSVQEAAPPQAHAQPLSSPLALGLAGVLVVSLLVKGYNVIVQSARRRKAETENAEVLQLDRAEQRRRYKSALNTDRSAPPDPEPPSS